MIMDSVSKFADGNYVFIYYRFLDKFHVEPTTWSDLFEYLHYNEVDSEILKLTQNMTEEGLKK